MRLQFLGAAREVTGSQYYLCTDGAKVLVDCGMFQEREFLYRNWDSSPVRPRDIDMVLLTHAHVDHCGLLPQAGAGGLSRPGDDHGGLGRPGRTGAPRFGPDSSGRRGLQEEAASQGRAAGRNSRRSPLHDARRGADAAAVATGRLRPPAADQRQPAAVFHDAGHILGSAMIELRGQGGRPLAAADLQRRHRPGGQALDPPAQRFRADRFPRHGIDLRRPQPRGPSRHRGATGRGDRRDASAAAARRSIPIFAIERAQELIYFLGRLLHAGRIPSVPVFLDSPMAAEVTEVFRRHRECLDAADPAAARRRRRPAGLPRADTPCGPSSSPRRSTI